MRADEVVDSLKELFAPPAYALLEQVGDATGYSARRHLDVIVMSTWPSRGLTLTGIEVKVSRGDWRTELRNPAKAEAVASRCDYFSIAAPKGVVPVEEVPTNWGLIEVNEKGKAAHRKQPVKLEAEPIDRRFLAAVLRRASLATPTEEMMMRANRDARAEAERQLESRVEYKTADLNGKLEVLRRRVAAFEEKTGLPLENVPRVVGNYGFPNGEELAKAYLFLAQGGAKRLQYQLNSLDHLIQRLQEERGHLSDLIDDDTLDTEEA